MAEELTTLAVSDPSSEVPPTSLNSASRKTLGGKAAAAELRKLDVSHSRSDTSGQLGRTVSKSLRSETSSCQSSGHAGKAAGSTEQKSDAGLLKAIVLHP